MGKVILEKVYARQFSQFLDRVKYYKQIEVVIFSIMLVVVSVGYLWLCLSLLLMFFFEITEYSYYHKQV